MAKSKTQYVCNECGSSFSKWSGQCGECKEWNSLEEVSIAPASTNNKNKSWTGQSAAVTSLQNVDTNKQESRISTGLSELDRTLGGGVVPGSIMLLGGDPGIGKSTLLLQAMANLAERMETLYITGEESLRQVALRAERLGLSQAPLKLQAETVVEAIINTAHEYKPRILVVDSIQTVNSDNLQSAAGSVAQVRECAAQLTRFAKQTHTAVFLVGHVNKEGSLAGPRVLEHMVDTVLSFEGDRGGRVRMIRAVKNRFGAVNELGVFSMEEKGLIGVSNPSAIFLSRHTEPVPGSVIMPTVEGTRPILVELQALVEMSPQGNPRRVTVGLEQNRLAMLLAVLHRHGGIAMFDQDVYINAVGGVRVSETASDLPVLLAALSSFRNRPLPPDLLAFGEVGLAGEVRPVPNGQERLKEAEKQGFKRALVPKRNAPKSNQFKSMQLIPVERLSEAAEFVMQ